MLSASPVSVPRWLWPVVIAAVVIVFAVRNLPWHLDDYDQAKQAFVSFEMVQEGHWWFQHTPAGKIATKPPLAGWISAGLTLATGQRAWDFAWRLPPLLCAAAIALLLARSGRQLAGTFGATLAVAAFGLNRMSPHLASLVRTDMMLTLAIFLAGWLVYEKLRTEKPWTTGERWALFAVLLASMLIKGPIAYAFLLPGLAAFWWLRRRTDAPALAWAGSWWWFGPLLFFGAWAGIGIWLSPEFYDEVVVREFLGRFTSGERAVHHNQPVIFYFWILLRDLFPWSIILIALGCVREVRARLARDPALLWLVCWSLGGLIFMSLVPSKRGDRIFPVVPPLCLLLPALAALLPQSAIARWRWSLEKLATAAVCVALLCSGGYVTWCVVQGYRTHQRALVDFGHKVRTVSSPGRIALVTGKDEGMLLYVGQTDFMRLPDAAEKWNAGEIDTLVVPRKELKAARELLPDSTVAFESVPAPEKFSDYACLVRVK